MQLTNQFIRFAIVGVLNTGIDLGLFTLLTQVVGLSPLIANPISFTTGAANSFLLNKYWTFGAGGRRREVAVQATKFAIVTVVVLLIHQMLLFLLHTQLDWPAVPVKVLAIGAGVLVGFVSNKVWTFRDTQA